MKETKNENRIKGQLKGRIIAGLVLLVVSVALLAVLIPTGVTYAKYIREIYDYTGAVAGDFHFSSNYLEEVLDNTTKTYTINNWEGKKFTFDFEIYNFDNSLRYNEEGLDCYYYLDTGLNYKNGSEWTEKNADEYELTYTATTQRVTKDDSGNDITETVDLMNEAYTYLVPDETSKDEGGNITKWKVYPVIKLPAMSSGFNRATGTHSINITIDFDADQTTPHEVKITAKSIPKSELGNIRTVSYNTAKDAETYETLNNAAGVTETDYDRIYGVPLVCVVNLNQQITVQPVTASYSRVDKNSQQLNYFLNCASRASSALTNVRVFFNSKRITADQNLLSNGRSEFEQATVEKDGVVTDMVDDYCDVRYIDTTVQSSCVKQLTFYTDWYGSQDTEKVLNIPDGKSFSYDSSTWTKNDNAVPDIWFEILDKEAETENYNYTLKIFKADGTDVTVKKAGTELKNGDSITNNDVLTVIFTGCKVTINGNPISSGESFKVAGDVTVETTVATAYDLSINQAAGTIVEVIRNGEAITGEDTIYEGDRLTIQVTRGTVTVNNNVFTSGDIYTVSGDVEVKSTAFKSYTLSIEAAKDTTIAVTRDGETLTDDDLVYQGDELVITVNGGYAKVTEKDKNDVTVRETEVYSGGKFTAGTANVVKIEIASVVDDNPDDDDNFEEDEDLDNEENLGE